MTTPLSFRVFEAEARIYRRVWRGSVFTSFFNPVLYLLAMGVGLGTLVDANLPGGVEGVAYLTFLAPGLLVATAMQTGAGEGAWKVMAGIKWQETWKARLATPIGIPSLLLGHILWSAARILMVSVIFAVVMSAFRVAPLFQSLLAVGPALLVGVAMLAGTTAFTVRLENMAGLPMFFRFVVIPMFLFSGAFFPVGQLPGWLQPVAVATPMYHGVELARTIVVGTTPGVAWWVSVAYLTAVIVAGAAISVAPMRRRLAP
ncbi:MAG: ABC transporter permease [Acidimicrobiia bacterium]|nr:MAG: ABC transporter permease [Acidimicrobiia bacterium]